MRLTPSRASSGTAASDLKRLYTGCRVPGEPALVAFGGLASGAWVQAWRFPLRRFLAAVNFDILLTLQHQI